MKELNKLKYIGFFLIVQLCQLVYCFKDCLVSQIEIAPTLLESLAQKNLTIADQPFLYYQKQIYQVAVENIHYELLLKTNQTTDRPIKQDPTKKSKYFLYLLENQLGQYFEKQVFSFEDKKIVDLVEVEQKLIVVFSQGFLRVINLFNQTLLEQSKESKVKDVEGAYTFKFRNLMYFAVYGRSLSVNRFKNGVLSNLYNETETYQFPIKNVVHSDGKMYYYTSQQLITVNLLHQEIERKQSIGDFQQSYLFQLMQNTLIILPFFEDNSTSTYMLYDLTYPSKSQQQLKLRFEFSSIKSAISQYQSQILVKNLQDEVKMIEFDENNIQLRDIKDEKLNLGIDFLTISSRQVFSLSLTPTGYNTYQCNHCQQDKYLLLSEVNPPTCSCTNIYNIDSIIETNAYLQNIECGYKCQECQDEKKCTLCTQSYSQLNGVCQCANRFVENLEKGICEKYEESDPTIKIIIISVVCVVIAMIGIVKYIQIKERKRIEAKQKVFKSTFKDDEEEGDENYDDEEDEEYNDENLQQNNVTALFDKKNPHVSLDSSRLDSGREALNVSVSKKAQKASQNKSFVNPKNKGQTVQLEDLEEQMQDRIHTINENQDEEDNYSDKEEHQKRHKYDDHEDDDHHQDDQYEDEDYDEEHHEDHDHEEDD